MGFKEFMSYCFVVIVYTAYINITKYLGPQMIKGSKCALVYKPQSKPRLHLCVGEQLKKGWNWMKIHASCHVVYMMNIMALLTMCLAK